MGRFFVMLAVMLCAFAPAYAQLQPGDVPSNEDLARSIDPNILGDIPDMPPVPFDPVTGEFRGCNGNPECEEVSQDIGSSTTPDMTDMDAIIEEGIPAPEFIENMASGRDFYLDETLGYCEEGTDAVTQTTTDSFEYRCNSGTNVQEVENRCELVLVHTVAPGYVYECTVETAPDGSLIVSDECELLDGDPSCTLDSSTCTDDNGTQLEGVSCRTGPATVQSTPSCERERVHELSLQYIYECEFVLNEETGEFEPDAQCQSHIDDGSCTQGGQECSDDRPPDTENISCVIGNELVYSSEACEASLQTVLDEKYYWNVNKDWDESQNPPAFVKSAEWLSAEAAACRFDQESCTVPEPVVLDTLSCQIGNRIEESTEQCIIPRVVVTDDDYFYNGDRIWSAAQSEFVGTAGWTKLDQLTSCVLQGSVCSTETPPEYEVYRCEEGYRVNKEGVSCDKDRIITVDTDYQYKGHSNWDEATQSFLLTDVSVAAIDAQCVKGVDVCVVDSPGVFSEEICQRGYEIEYELETVTRDLLVVTDDDYIYQGLETWDGDAFISNAARNTLVSQPTNCVEQSRVCTQVGSGVFSKYICDEGYRDTYTESGCDVPRIVSVDRDYLYQADRVFQYGPDVWNSTSELTALKASSACTYQSEQCVTPSPGVFDTLTCDIGTRTDYTMESGTRERVAVVDEDYIYERYRTWNGSTHAGNASWTSVNNDATCVLQDSVCSTETPQPYTEYTCQSGYQDNLTSPSCQRERVVTVDLDYQYTVGRLFDTGTNTWTSESDWNAVRAASQCVLQSETCAVPSPGVTTELTCQRGYRHIDSTETCTDVKSFTVDRDYQYTAYQNWSGTAWTGDAAYNLATAASCQRTSGPTNQVPVSDLSSSYRCLKGWVDVGSTSTCDVPLNVTVTGSNAYEYVHTVSDTWYDGTPEPELDDSIPAGCTFNHWIHQNGWTRGHPSANHQYRVLVRNLTCSSTQTGSGWNYMGTTTVYSESDSWNTSSCPGGTPQSEVCIEGASTKVINGQSVTRSCWKKRRTYGSTVRRTVNTCQVPSGYSLQSTSAYSANYGSARSLTWQNYAKAESRANAANVRNSYDCTTSCSPPSGVSTLRSNKCIYTAANGSCAVYHKNYAVDPQNAPGGYERKRSVFRCENQLSSSAGTPTILREKKADTWNTSQCDAVDNGFSEGCVQTSAGYVGSATNKTVDGLTISDRWNYRRTFTCTQRENIDTCGSLASNSFHKPKSQFAQNGADSYWNDIIPKFEFNPNKPKVVPAVIRGGNAQAKIILASAGDTTYTGQTCIAYVDGVCTLWERTYDREETDPSGGCHDEREVWRCENAVSGAGTATILREVESDTFSMATCNAMVASHDSCTLVRQTQDTSTGGSRVINGLSVSRPFWAYKREYNCTDRVTTETCSPPAGAVIHDVECLWEDANDVCRLVRRNYRIPEPDPSGGCTTFKDTFRCDTRNHGTNNVGVAHEIVSEKFPAPAGYPSRRGCVRQSYTWAEPETRVVNGLSMYRRWAIHEEFECSSEIEIDTCTPLPSGATQSGGASCIAANRDGSCGVERLTYRYPVDDPSGGCLRVREEHACTDLVTGAGSPVAIPRSIDAESWNTSACAAQIANDNCELLEDTCIEGAETRIIDSLPVYQACWKSRRIYECSARTDINTCDIPDGATFDSETCLWTDREGVCRLKKKRYLREEHDPSGGCSEYTSDFRCEETVSGLTPTETISHYVSNSWDREPYSQMLAANNYDRCAYQAPSRCVEPGGERIFNGVPVTRSCWSREFDYECEEKITHDTCESWGTSTIESQECLWTDRNGVCRLQGYTLKVPEIDPSGGCHSIESTYTCEDALTWGGDNSPIRGDDLLGASDWPPAANLTGVPRIGYAQGGANDHVWSDTQGPYGGSVTTILAGQGDTLNAGGGGRTLYHTIDGSKAYEVSLYFKVTELDKHRVYAGLWARDQVMSYNGIANRNPYFTYVTPTAAAGYEADTWYKIVGVILPEGSAPEAHGTYGGIYNTTDGRKIQDIAHFIWNEARPNDNILVRFFNVYGTENQGLYTHFYSPSLREASGIGLSRELDTLDVVRDAGLLQDETVSQAYDVFRELKSIDTNVIDTAVCQAALTDRGTCREVSSVCSAPNETRNIDGLDVTQACWSYRVEYECSTTQIINTCEIPAGAIANGTNCLWSDDQGVCRLTEKIYNVPLPDPTNGCSVWTDTYRCEDQQSGVGDIIDTVTHVESINWDNSACDALDLSGRTCAVEETCSAGTETRVINGVSVTQACWEQTRDLACKREIPVDTCDVPFDAVQTASTCALSNDAGNCILWDREYEWRVRDGSGGCHQYESRVLCDDRSVISRTPEDYGYVLGATTLDMSVCNQIPANDNTCREQSRVCTDSSPTTRRPTNVVNLNGDEFVPAKPSAVPEVNRECWEYDVTYECEQSTPVDTCSTEELQGCRIVSEVCGVVDRDGDCARVDKVYDCDVEGTGGCVSQTTTFSCEVNSPPTTQEARYVPAAKPVLEKPSLSPSYDYSFGEQKAQIIFAKSEPLQFKVREPIQLAQASGSTDDYDPIRIIASVERAYWDNTSCSVRDDNAACDLISTTCTEEGTGGAEQVRRAQDDFHQQYVGIAETVVVPCWNEQKVYECQASSGLSDCTDEAERCEAESETCLLLGDDGECLLSETSYQCGAAQCEPSRQICDFRHGKAEFEGYKYTCTQSGWVDEGVVTYVEDNCLGFDQACTSSVVRRDLERFFVETGEYDRFGEPIFDLDVTHFGNQTKAFYCPSPQTGLTGSVNDLGYVVDGSDAVSASCAAIEANASCTLIADNCVVGLTRQTEEGLEPVEICEGGRRKVFDCEQSDPDAVCSGGCTNWEDTYTCETEIDGVDPVEVTDPEILSGIDSSACTALNDNEDCVSTGEVCVEGEETRLLDGVPVYASCWRWERTYSCAENTGFETDCEVPTGCELSEEICLAESASGECLTTEHVYACTETNEVVVTDENPGTCEDEGDTDPYADPNEDDQPEGSSLFDVVAGLNSVSQGADDYQTEPSLFEGEDLKCSKWIFGSKNCCKDKGLLIGLGCDAQEEKLAVAKDEDLCISVGSYCSKKTFFGTCLKKKETYCCYKSELARIVVEAGVQQIGKDLGTPKNPTCDGFSVTQFQLLDLGQADFSGVADSMLEDMNMGDPDEIAARLRQRIGELQGGGG